MNMRKKSLLKVLFCASVVIGFTACEETIPVSSDGSLDTYGFGYCENETETGLGVGGEALLGAAVQMKGSEMIQHGDSIIGIRCGVVASGTGFKVNIFSDLTNEVSLFEKTVGDVTGYTWVYVPLDKPMAIDAATDLYFAYKLTTSNYALGYNSGSGTTRDYVYYNGWDLLTNSGLKGSMCIQAVLKGGDYSSETQYQVKTQYVDYSKVVITGNSQTISCYVTNLGTKYVDNVKIDYTYGGVTGSYTVNNVGLVFGQSVKCDLPAVTTVGDGTLPISLSVSTEGQTTPHTFTASQYASLTEGLPRTILLEQFTGQACVYCPGGATSVKTAIAGLSAADQNRVIWVAHHAGYLDDTFTITGNKTIATYFGVNSAPSCMIDRTAFDSSLGLVFHPGYLTTSSLQTMLAMPAFAEVNIAHTYDTLTRELNVTVSGESALTTAKLTVLLIQSGITASQSTTTGTNASYVHNNAPRVFLTSALGDAVEYADGSYSKSFTYTIPDNVGNHACIPADMEIVAFLSEYGTTKTACPVSNAAKVPVLTTNAETLPAVASAPAAETVTTQGTLRLEAKKRH